MKTCADSIRVMCPLFQTEEGGSTPTSALQLRFYRCEMETAIALNRLWHSRLPIIKRGNVIGGLAFAAGFRDRWYASAIWTKPISQGLPQSTWLELRRFAIAEDAPKNTASRMLSWMVRQIQKLRPEVVNLISYQDLDVHLGTIYKASGWHKSSVQPRARTWTTKQRTRNIEQALSPKQRWEKRITME